MITLEQIREKFLEELKQNLKHMTQKQLAEKIGVSQQAIAQYLHQRKLPALDTFANLCIALDFDPADILCLNEERKKDHNLKIVKTENVTDK